MKYFQYRHSFTSRFAQLWKGCITRTVVTLKTEIKPRHSKNKVDIIIFIQFLLRLWFTFTFSISHYELFEPPAIVNASKYVEIHIIKRYANSYVESLKLYLDKYGIDYTIHNTSSPHKIIAYPYHKLSYIESTKTSTKTDLSLETAHVNLWKYLEKKNYA
jgi:hypothetical protein